MRSTAVETVCNYENIEDVTDEAESFLMKSLGKLTLMGQFKIELIYYINPILGHVAQLDRASDSGSESRGFESLHARKLQYQLYRI